MPAMVNRNFQQAGLVQLARARALIDAAGSRARLQADGDISLANVGAVAASGVDDIVVGRALFGSSDRAAAVQALRDALAAARAAAAGQVPA
jgi:ribulose-phosphate 3-epimerase